MKSLRIVVKPISVKLITAIYRKLGGATLLLALWLSLAPATQGANAQKHSSLNAHAPVALTQLLVGQKAVLTKESAVASEKPGRGGSSGDVPILPLFGIPAPLLTPSRLHGLPASTGPPPSSTPRHFRARAPPVA